MSAERDDRFFRAFVWTAAVTFSVVLAAALLVLFRPSEAPAAENAARLLADQLGLDLSRERQTEGSILSDAGGQALGIEQIDNGVRLTVRVREDADSSGWPCFRLTIRRSGPPRERSGVERLPSCPVAAPLRPSVDPELSAMEDRLRGVLEGLPNDLESEAVVLGDLVKAGLPAASAQVDEDAKGVAYVAIGAQPRCVLGYVRPHGADRSASRVLVWPAPPNRPCSSATAAVFAGLY